MSKQFQSRMTVTGVTPSIPLGAEADDPILHPV
jgi:hypothetical protein